VAPRAHPARAACAAALDTTLAAHGAELVLLAGFMRVLTAGFVLRWKGRMLNIHPSILPLFPGLETHARALAAGMAVHGCTVHEVTPDLDSGPIRGQAVVPVLPGDTPATLAARVLPMEHRLYPAVLRRFAAGDTRPVALFP
jgi:phosphoribosylglycinamide formyltransferase-1